MNLFTGRAVSALMKSLVAKVVTPLTEGVFKVKKLYKPMVTSSQEEIDLHNSTVKTRQVKRSKTRFDKKLGK
jgi:large-conductance mechanosensitive channel